jgi:prepilin-type N-terminal cleavage/methylation domain-containing protein
MQKNKAFTLLELLVVIVIIGLLSAIVYISLMVPARERARMARALNFSAQVHRALGSDAMGWWKFDEGEGSIVYDLSGNNNHGTIINSPVWRCAEEDLDYTPDGKGCSLEFINKADEVRISGANFEEIGKSIRQYTVSAWIKTEMPIVNLQNSEASANSYIFNKWNFETINRYPFNFRISNVHGWYSSWWYHTGPNVYDGVSCFVGDNKRSLNDGKWHYLAATYDLTTGKLAIYTDGTLGGMRDDCETNPEIWNNENLYMAKGGGYYCFSTTDPECNYRGLINEVAIYSRSLTAFEIQSLYYAGLNNLYAKGQITEKEFQERIK